MRAGSVRKRQGWGNTGCAVQMADLVPFSWEVRFQSKVYAVCMLLPYFSIRNIVAPSVAPVASAKTAVSGAVFAGGIPSCTAFRRQMLEYYLNVLEIASFQTLCNSLFVNPTLI